MKLTILLITAVCCLIPTDSFAQNNQTIDFVNGPFVRNRNSFMSEFLTTDNGDLFRFTHKSVPMGFKYILENYDQHMVLQKTIVLNKELMVKSSHLQTVKTLGNNLVVFTYDRTGYGETQKYVLYYSVLSGTDLSTLQPETKLYEVFGVRNGLRSYTSITKVDHGKKLLVNSNIPPEKTDAENKEYHGIIIHSDFSISEELVFDFPFSYKELKLEKWFMHDDQIVVLGKWKSVFKLFQFDQDSDMSDMDLYERDKYGRMTMDMDKNGDLVFVSMYVVPNEWGNIDNIELICKRIKMPEMEEVNSTVTQMSYDFITEGWTDKEIEKTKSDKRVYARDYPPNWENTMQKIDHIYFKEDGGIILVGQSQFTSIITSQQTVPRTSFAGGGAPMGTMKTTYHTTSSTSVSFYEGDVAVFSLDSNLNLTWAKKITKRPYPKDGRNSEYHSQIYQDNVHVFFIAKGKHIPGLHLTKNDGDLYKLGLFVHAIIDETGTIEYNTVWKMDYQTLIPRMSRTSLLKDGSFLLYTHNKKNKKYMLKKALIK